MKVFIFSLLLSLAVAQTRCVIDLLPEAGSLPIPIPFGSCSGPGASVEVNVPQSFSANTVGVRILFQNDRRGEIPISVFSPSGGAVSLFSGSPFRPDNANALFCTGGGAQYAASPGSPESLMSLSGPPTQVESEESLTQLNGETSGTWTVALCNTDTSVDGSLISAQIYFSTEATDCTNFESAPTCMEPVPPPEMDEMEGDPHFFDEATGLKGEAIGSPRRHFFIGNLTGDHVECSLSNDEHPIITKCLPRGEFKTERTDTGATYHRHQYLETKMFTFPWGTVQADYFKLRNKSVSSVPHHKNVLINLEFPNDVNNNIHLLNSKGKSIRLSKAEKRRSAMKSYHLD